MSNCLIKAILPDEQIIKVDLNEGLFLSIKLLIIFLYWTGYAVHFMGFSWIILRLEEGCWWRQSMVVHQQLGPEVGHQPIKCLMTMVKNWSILSALILLFHFFLSAKIIAIIVIITLLFASFVHQTIITIIFFDDS
jgi:hypothetical protein